MTLEEQQSRGGQNGARVMPARRVQDGCKTGGPEGPEGLLYQDRFSRTDLALSEGTIRCRIIDFFGLPSSDSAHFRHFVSPSTVFFRFHTLPHSWACLGALRGVLKGAGASATTAPKCT